jgi:hypothetical protein
MINLIYPIALILIIAWGIGTFGYTGGSMLLVLLAIAIIAIILGVIQRLTSR